MTLDRLIHRDVWDRALPSGSRPHAVHEPHDVRVFMANLRKKLERMPGRPEWLLTEQGVGYRLRA